MKPGDLVIMMTETTYTSSGDVCLLIETPPPQRWFSSRWTFEEVALLHGGKVMQVPKHFIKPLSVTDDKA